MKKSLIILTLMLLPSLAFSQYWILKNRTLLPASSSWRVGAGSTAFGSESYVDSVWTNLKIQTITGIKPAATVRYFTH